MSGKYDAEIDEIIELVGKDLDRAEIEKLFKNFTEEFRLSPTESKKLIARKFGATLTGSAEATSKHVAELTTFDRNVDLLCRVLFAIDKTITVDGEEKDIISGILGDDSGTVPFTLWNKGDVSLQKGDVVKVENAYITEWKEEAQVNIGDRGTLTKVDSSELPPYNGSGRKSAPVKISELGDVTGNISMAARVLTAENREVNVSGEMKNVISGIMADETGKVSYTCWGKGKFKRGDVVNVNNGYLRRWRGMPQFNFDHTAVEKSKEKMPSEEELARPVDVRIEELAKIGGMVDAGVAGVILDVRQGSGLVFRCPECNRVLQKNLCRVHGEVEGAPDLRIKAVLDDSTGAVSIIMGKDITERILNKSLNDCLKEAKKAMDHEVIKDELFDLLVARPMRVTGNATSDDFGLMLIANNAEFMSVDVYAEAQKMLEELA